MHGRTVKKKIYVNLLHVSKTLKLNISYLYVDCEVFVSKFKYLGSAITDYGKNKEDIMQKIIEAKVMFNNKKNNYNARITLGWKRKRHL
jgi:hypothetical protein